MRWSPEVHWKIVTLFARIVGVAFVVGGFVVAAYGARLLLDKDASVLIDDIETRDWLMKAIVLAGGLIVTALGALLLRAQPIVKSKGKSA